MNQDIIKLWVGEGDRKGSSRIDLALCSEGILEYAEGIGVDTKKRTEGMDHRWVTVDLSEMWWGEQADVPLAGSDWDSERGQRINTGSWTSDDWKKYRQIAGGTNRPEECND